MSRNDGISVERQWTSPTIHSFITTKTSSLVAFCSVGFCCFVVSFWDWRMKAHSIYDSRYSFFLFYSHQNRMCSSRLCLDRRQFQSLCSLSFCLFLDCLFFLMKRAKKLVSFSFKKQKKVNSFYCSWPSHILWEQQVLVFIVACLNVRLAMKGSSHAMW